MTISKYVPSGMKKKKNGIFRIIQSIPSPKAEPFKLWLSEVGKEGIDEIIDPERIIDRALETYLKKGYSGSHDNRDYKNNKS